jgi:hypothetical protein
VPPCRDRLDHGPAVKIASRAHPFSPSYLFWPWVHFSFTSSPPFLALFSPHVSTGGRRRRSPSPRQLVTIGSAAPLGLHSCSGRPRLGCGIPLPLFPLQSMKVKQGETLALSLNLCNVDVLVMDSLF